MKDEEVVGKKTVLKYCFHCGKVLGGRKTTFCNDVCRSAAKRAKAKELKEIEQAKEAQRLEQIKRDRKPSLKDYQENPKDYVKRLYPELLNWDKPLSKDDLQASRFIRNREVLSGDWDYKGIIDTKEYLSILGV